MRGNRLSRDSSGHENHGVNHGVNPEDGTFDGVGAYLEVPDHPSLNLGTGDFSISARIHTEAEVNDILGDVLEKYDPDLRRGITLSIKSSAGGYQSQGTDRHVCFGIDNARISDWKDCGRPSRTSNYVSNSLTVFQGKLHGGSIPRAEVCRCDGAEQWTSLKRFYSPPDWQPVSPADNGGQPTREEVSEWSRVTSLTIHDGRLFASIGSCTSSVLDAPADVRGRFYSLEAGKCVSYENDPGPGWKHLVAIRHAGLLKIYVDGNLVAKSTAFDPAEYDLSNDRSLRIGFGQTDYFCGKIADMRIYHRALSEEEIAKLCTKPGETGR